MPMQPQEKPRGHAMTMCKTICKSIERKNRSMGMRVGVHQILRALEWTRYCLTEAYMDQLEMAAGEAGFKSFTPVNSRTSGKRKGGSVKES